MIRNVFRRTLGRRVRLVSVTFLTVLVLSGYLLAFFSLESLVHLRDVPEHSRVDGSGSGVASLCKEILMEGEKWKDATFFVLTRLSEKDERVKEILSYLQNERVHLEGVERQKKRKKRIDRLRYNDGNDRQNNVNSPQLSKEKLTDRLREILHKICIEYTLRMNVNIQTGYHSSIRESRDDKESSVIAIEEGGLEVDKKIYLRKIIESMNDERKKSMGENDIELKKVKNAKRWRLNIHGNMEGLPLPAWKVFHNRISQYSLYEDDENNEFDHLGDKHNSRALLSRLVKSLAMLDISSVDEISSLGTQLKYIFNLHDGSRALFKPMRAARGAEETLDTYYMYERERHTSEIASFHLDRILGFRRVPPATGRVIDMINDLQVFLSPHSKKKFYLSPVGNQCFFGKCLYYCDPAHGVCGRGKMLEGSLVAFLPNKTSADWSSIKNPWSRSYSKYNRSYWEKEPNGRSVCSRVRSQPPFDEWSSILNLIDIHIFDFLIGNKDRHHFHFFDKFGNKSSFVLIDNGKGFGRYSHDIIDILAPLYQCCMIRFTTLRTLFQMHTSPDKRLSQLMKESLSSDVLPDILTSAHLRALDRRVRIILERILTCIGSGGRAEEVVIDDDFFIVSPTNS